jgi:hypothetical protein
MKRIAAVLLIVLLPTALMAQTAGPPKVTRSKTKWIAIGSVIGGAGLAFAAVSSKGSASSAKASSGFGSSSISSVASVVATTGGVAGVAASVGIPSAPGGTNPPGTSGPVAVPGTSAASPFPTIATLTMTPNRGTNWKMVGPAIGLASVGGILLYRDHQNKKRAEIALKSPSAVQFAFSW